MNRALRIQNVQRGIALDSRALRRMQNPEQLRQALRLPFPFRKKVVIIGGGFSGCELADTLAELGKNVTILEPSKRLGYDIGITTQRVVMPMS